MNTNKQSKAKLTVINGNRIIMISNPSYISSTIGFMIKAGSSNDFKGKKWNQQTWFVRFYIGIITMAT